MPAQQIPDGFHLNPNGTARLTVDGQSWQLRRPKLGQFRQLREQLHERDDARLRLIASYDVAGDKPVEDATADEKLAYTLDVNARSRKLADEVTALNVAWLEQALVALCDRPPPDVDDWPSGMDSSDTIAELVQHWRSAPLRSGGS